MGRLASAFSRPSSEKALALVDLLRGTSGWRTSASGKNVSTVTAIEVSAVMACMRVRANGLAQVPLKLMRESADGSWRTPAKDHSLYYILANRPNDFQTSFEYREMLMMHLTLCGNAFSFINRSNRSGIMELIPFEPGSVTVKRADNATLTYEVRAQNGSVQTFPASSIWHIKGPSWNSWMGLEAVKLARESIGLAMAVEEQQSTMQKNGVRASGTYSVAGTLKPDQYKLLKDWIDENYAGAAKDGSPMIVDRDAKWTPHTMTGVDAQTIETRRFQVEEICRHFLVNPIMIFAESKNTTYASAEQQFLAHVVHTLSPEYFRIEQSIDANLLTDKDRAEGLYSCFVDEGLLRASMTDKKDVLLGYVNGGLMTQNEGREKLDLNPDPDPESSKLHRPANIAGGSTDPVDDTPAKALALMCELKGMMASNDRPHPPINVDARTSVTNTPQPITVNVPEQKAADIKVDVAAPFVTVNQPDIAVHIASAPSSTKTTFVRDKLSGEIISSTTEKG
jgi:HK97 family phage portal protein